MSSAQAELREVQRRHGGIRKLIAGETRLGNTAKAAELEKEFLKLATKMRKLETIILDEAADVAAAKEKADKEIEKQKAAKKKSNSQFEQLMSNVRDVDDALISVRKAAAGEKDSHKKAKLYREESKLKKLWSRLVKAAAEARAEGK